MSAEHKIDLRDASRTKWYTTITPTDKNASLYPGDKNIELGCLMRMAGSLEQIADNTTYISRQRDMYKEAWEKELAKNKALRKELKELKKK